MIHHQPYDEYEASRASSAHYQRGNNSHRNMPSPPSFYSIPPPPPAPMTNSEAPQHHPSNSHQPPPPSHLHHHPHSMLSQHHLTNQTYYPSAPHPYMTYYPPPPSNPSAMPSHDPPRSTANDRAHMKRKSDYDEHHQQHAPFSPYDYQCHYTYGQHTGPASAAPTMSYSKGPSHQHPIMPSHSFELTTRGPKVNNSGRNSSGDVYGMALGDQQPTYVGHIKSANDAILLLSACDLPATAPLSPNNKSSSGNVLPPPRRVTRRLLDAERADLVSSGSVFVWDEKEAGMKRWTDGRVWSASRVSGCFLTYRELEARKKVNNGSSTLVDGPATNQYKPEGLIKQSFSITTTSGRKLHVISYFTKRDIREGRLRRVGEDPRFVGEGGGEWGLKVDEQEYSFPDMQQIARSQAQGENGGATASNEAGDEYDSDMSDLSDRRSSSPHRRPAVAGTAAASPEMINIIDKNLDSKRKRPVKAEDEDDQEESNLDRLAMRPRFNRVRSSSLSGIRQANNQSSFQSNSSLATTIPSEPASKSKEVNSTSTFNKGLTVTTASNTHGRSSAIRALVSPTLPRESAVRGGTCEMKPTQSQDCANAVGALLSLAGNNSDYDTKESTNVSSPVQAADTTAPTTNTSTPSPTSASSLGSNQQGVGLGLNIKPLPKRRDLDHAAINQFSVRL